MSLRNRPWSRLEDALGPATGLGDLLDGTRHPSAHHRTLALKQLTQRLVVVGRWVSAAPKAAEILLADALMEDTPEQHLLFDLLRSMINATGESPPSPTPVGEELLEVVRDRIDDLLLLEEPPALMRRSLVRLLDALDGPLPEGPDADPTTDVALAVARARRALPVSAGPLGTALASLWGKPDVAGLVKALVGRREHLPSTMEPARWIASRLSDRPTEGAELFATAIETHPTHPDVEAWARQVGQLGFPRGLDDAPPTGPGLTLLARCLQAPLPRDALGIGGLPPRRADARRYLGLDPPALLERDTPEGPIWRVLEGRTDDLEHWRSLPLSASETLSLAGQTLGLPYWLDAVPHEVLAELSKEVNAPGEWATGFLEGLADEREPGAPERWLEHEPPIHANVALQRLVEAGQSIAAYAGLVSFNDAPERTAGLLAAMPQQRDRILLAYLANPDRPDFQEPQTLQAALPHLEATGQPLSDAMVEAALRCLEAILGMLHHPPELQTVVRDTVRWAERTRPSRVAEWRKNLLEEELDGLLSAERQGGEP